MAPTAEGNTSIRPHWRAWTRAVVVLEAMGSPWYNSALPTREMTRESFSSTPNRKVPHGQALRDLRQGAAIRTPRQSRQEPGQPEVLAQPADGPRDGGWTARARANLHALPAHLRCLAKNPGRAPRRGASDPSAAPPTPAPEPRRRGGCLRRR